MVFAGLAALEPTERTLLFVENVGNLVCPAMFDLGERIKVLVASVTEGEDKPLKYPHMFRAADVLVLSKIDLLPYLCLDLAAFVDAALAVNPRLSVFTVSGTTGEGLAAWCDYLRASTREGAPA